MKRLNNKAFTIVELIVTFALVMTISLGLFKVIDSYRQKQQRASYKKEMVNYKNEIIKVVKDDIYKYGLKKIRTDDVYRPTVPTSEKINQFINLSFKNGGGDKTLFFGQEGCDSGNSNCTGKYYIKYGDIKYRVPNDFIRLEDDVIYSCDVKDQVETAKALIVNSSSSYQADITKESYCRINFRMKHTEIKDEEVIRIAAWYLDFETVPSINPNSTSGIPYRELILNYINPNSDSNLNSLSNIMTLKIPCSTTNPTVSKISDQVKGKLSNATLIIGSACTSIADEAFKNATSIKTLVFEPRNSGTKFEIGASAFEGVPLEGKVTLPEGLEKISKRAFYGNGLTRFIVPSSLVETVGGVKQAKFSAGENWNNKNASDFTPIVVLK